MRPSRPLTTSPASHVSPALEPPSLPQPACHAGAPHVVFRSLAGPPTIRTRLDNDVLLPSSGHRAPGLSQGGADENRGNLDTHTHTHTHVRRSTVDGGRWRHSATRRSRLRRVSVAMQWRHSVRRRLPRQPVSTLAASNHRRAPVVHVLPRSSRSATDSVV